MIGLNNEIVEALADKVANRVLEKIQERQHPLMTRKEVINQIGRRQYEKACQSGLFSRIKRGSKNSKTFIRRSEFNQFMQHPKAKLII